MPVPPSVTPRVVRGTYVSSAGVVQRGTITFRVSQPLIATVESWGVVPTPEIVTLDTSGSFTISLMSSSDLDLFPSGFRYNVQERFQNGYIRTYSIELPSSSSPLDLPSASQYDPGDTGLAIVHSINGRTGIVQLSPLDLGAIPLTQKAAANGVASLDSSGKLTASQMPAPTAGVASVDGRAGTVLLNDLYAALGHTHTFPVTSVNGSTGAVTLTAASVSAIPASEKGAASGVASLDSAGHLLLAHFPEEAWVDVFDANSQAAMLALPANRSDICRRTDTNLNYMLIGNDPSVLSNWKQFLTPTPPVTSVNTATGAVVLNAADVGAVATTARGAANGVASLDAGTKVPTAQIPDLDGAKITTGLIDFYRIPTGATSTTVSVGNHTHSYVPLTSVGAVNGVASLDSSGRVPVAQIPASVGGVNSVNGFTGVVTLTAANVSALPTTARGSLNGVASLDASGFVPTSQIPNLDATKITTGTVDINRLPTGTASNQVSLGNHAHAYVPTSDRGVPNGVATLDGTGKVPLTQLPASLGVASVNGFTGTVTLTATDVSAIPVTEKGAASGVATLDGGSLVPISQIPTGNTSSTVAKGGHIHGAVKAFSSIYITTGNTNPLPNTSGAWVELDSTKYRVTLAAAVGDLIVATIDMAYDPQGTGQVMDFALLVGGTPVRYTSSGTATPATNGDPALSYGAGSARTTGYSRMTVLQAGDVSGGLVTFSLMTKGNGTSGTVYSSTAVPMIVNLLNHGPAAASGF